MDVSIDRTVGEAMTSIKVFSDARSLNATLSDFGLKFSHMCGKDAWTGVKNCDAPCRPFKYLRETTGDAQTAHGPARVKQPCVKDPHVRPSPLAAKKKETVQPNRRYVTSFIWNNTALEVKQFQQSSQTFFSQTHADLTLWRKTCSCALPARCVAIIFTTREWFRPLFL